MADEQTTDVTNSATTATSSPADSGGSQQSEQATSTTEKPNDQTILSGASGDSDGAAGDSGTGGDGAPADGGDAGEAGQPNVLLGAPEGDYEIVGLPEGTTLDQPVIDAIAPIAKEIGLSNEGMSKLAGVYAETVLPHVTQQIVSKIEGDIATTRTQWAEELRASVEGEAADPVYSGAKLGDVTRIAAKAIDRFGGSEFREYLDTTGLGNHPAMLKLLYQAGTKIAEPSDFERGGTTPRPKTDAEIFYGGSN